MTVITDTDPRTRRVLELARDLVRRPSVTPEDRGCQAMLESQLAPIGFDATVLRFGEVSNLWARRGADGPLFVFAGHTDVVPTGSAEAWRYPPFEGVVENGMLHGRGAADMKGSLAAMISAVESFVARHPEHPGSIAFLLTSDEEGPAVDGTARVVEHLVAKGIAIDYCVVGEPTSVRRAGDMVKVGRRGSLTGAIRVKGRQGHVAYPQLASNPVPAAARLIAVLDAVEWDRGNERFPPTTFQVSNIHAGTGAGNVIPGHVDILCNFRFSPESTPEELMRRVQDCCRDQRVDCDVEWTLFGMPFETGEGVLLEAVRRAVHAVTGLETECSTTGGTSDGRFIAPTGAQVVELGPVNETIHRVDECISIDDLVVVSRIYERILENVLVPASSVAGS